MEILALIPARSGSKSIPHKNIRPLAGKPLLAYSIEHARCTRSVTRTIVSTDSESYAELAREFGAETPFIRPSNISGDHATDLEVFEHAIDWLNRNEGYTPEICVHLRPTHPVRKSEDIDQMVAILVENPDIDSVRSVAAAPATPFKMWFRSPQGMLTPVVQTDIQEAFNQPRQCLPRTYLQNAAIDVVRTAVISRRHSMTGSRIFGYVMQEFYDIDTEAEFERAEARLQTQAFETRGKVTSRCTKTFVVDIDGVIASLVPSLQYEEARPNAELIRVINFLYRQGHRIILFTARGTLTGQDWRNLTRKQMNDWGVLHHELRFGKPAADYYLDDKLLSVSDLRAMASSWGLEANNGRAS